MYSHLLISIDKSNNMKIYLLLNKGWKKVNIEKTVGIDYEVY